MDEDPLFVDLAAISASCVRRLYPACRITILTDDASRKNLGHARPGLSAMASKIRSVGSFDGGARMRSRFVKTQARNVIEGDFLYLDADTVAVSEFNTVFECTAPLSAAIDRNRIDPDGGFPAWVMPDFRRLGWRYPTRLYLNSGVVFWRDSAAAHALGRLWHDNWLRYAATVDNPADQPAFNHSIATLGIEPHIMDDVFNARVGVSPKFTDGARIYHLLSGNERAEGTFIDALMRQYRRAGRFEWSVIDAVVARGHPWVGTTDAPSPAL